MRISPEAIYQALFVQGRRAVLWRVGGVAEALRPLHDRGSLGASLNRLLAELQGTLPRSIQREFSPQFQDAFVLNRNAFTHIKRGSDGRALGFSDVHELAQDSELIKLLLRAASCFVCGDLSYRAHLDDNIEYWTRVLAEVMDEHRLLDLLWGRDLKHCDKFRDARS